MLHIHTNKNEPYSLFVLPEYQNLGYEQALLSKAIQMNGTNTMMTLVDVNAKKEIKIYEEAGFEVIKGQNSNLCDSYNLLIKD